LSCSPFSAVGSIRGRYNSASSCISTATTLMRFYIWISDLLVQKPVDNKRETPPTTCCRLELFFDLLWPDGVKHCYLLPHYLTENLYILCYDEVFL
jgi:hypothetical protein